MNKQGKGGIEYLNFTFNPVTGCNHPCRDKYCYAAKIAKRFGGNTEYEYHGLHILDRPMYKRTKAGKLMVDPYPYGFEPTFHKYRLNEPAKLKKPSIIGVVYMGDLFGEWVPDEWITDVFDIVRYNPQHKFLFLTKNPKGIQKFIKVSNFSIIICGLEPLLQTMIVLYIVVLNYFRIQAMTDLNTLTGFCLLNHY